MCDIALSEMPRKNRTFKLDDRVLEALERLAQRHNTSANRYLENLLFSHGKTEGEISMGEMPLGDSRGGKREKAGRPKTVEPEPKEEDEPLEASSDDEAK